MSKQQVSGIHAAIVTPVDYSGAISGERFARHARWLLRHGCHGLGIFTVTGEDGTFTIKGVPPGEVEIVAWHESARLDGQKTATATVAAGQTASVDFAFAPKAKGEKKE